MPNAEDFQRLADELRKIEGAIIQAAGQGDVATGGLPGIVGDGDPVTGEAVEPGEHGPKCAASAGVGGFWRSPGEGPAQVRRLALLVITRLLAGHDWRRRRRLDQGFSGVISADWARTGCAAASGLGKRSAQHAGQDPAQCNDRCLALAVMLAGRSRVADQGAQGAVGIRAGCGELLVACGRLMAQYRAGDVAPADRRADNTDGHDEQEHETEIKHVHERLLWRGGRKVMANIPWLEIEHIPCQPGYRAMILIFK